jgi:hypothetical protein
VLDVRASDAAFAEAARHCGPQAPMHIALAAGQCTLAGRVTETLDVEPEQLRASG